MDPWYSFTFVWNWYSNIFHVRLWYCAKSSTVALLVQFFFAWRIYVLASSRYIIPVVGAIILVSSQ